MSRRSTLHAAEAPVLRHLLALLLSRPPPTTVTHLFPGRAGRVVRATYFLLQREEPLDVEEFLTHHLPRLLLGLQCRTVRRTEQLRGRIQGKIDWAQTMKHRFSAGGDPTGFACRPSRRDYDTPENQSLKALLMRLGECLALVPSVIRGGVCYFPHTAAHEGETIGARLGRMEAALMLSRRHGRLASVELPAEIEEEHFLRAETSKTEEYALAALLFRRLRSRLDDTASRAVYSGGRRMLPLPARPGGPGEPWIRLASTILTGGDGDV